MITKVLPAIKQKWPDWNQSIVIQQDGASAQIDEYDPQFVATVTSGSWNISLMTQSPKSPDLNVLDLSFLQALQSKEWSKGYAKTEDKLIDTVLLAFDEFDPVKLNFGWLTFLSCFDNVINCRGDNDYPFLHTQKEKRICNGTLPNLLFPSDKVLEVFDMMASEGAVC